MNKSLLLTLAAAALPLVAGAAVSFSGGTYLQDFSSLDWNAGESRSTWTNDSTLAGWSITSSTTATQTQPVWSGYDDASQAAGNLQGADANTYIKVAQRLINYELNDPNPAIREWDGNNRLGFRTGSTPSNSFATLQLTNTTGIAIDAFSVGYQGAQFFARESGAIDVRYSFDGSNWTTINGGGGTTGSTNMRYTAPVTSAGVNKNLIDTEVLASIQDISANVTGITWANNTSLYVQFAFWRDIPGGSTGSSPVLTIDNVSFTAVPEPSAYAALLGALALAGVALRRRMRR
jgi:hypothetical protein